MVEEVSEMICKNIAKYYSTEQALADWLKGGGLIPRSLNFLACIEIRYPGDEEDEVVLSFYAYISAWDYNTGTEEWIGVPPDTEAEYYYKLGEIEKKRDEILKQMKYTISDAFDEIQQACWEDEEADYCEAFKKLLELDDDKKAELMNKVAEDLVNEVIDFTKEEILAKQQ